MSIAHLCWDRIWYSLSCSKSLDRVIISQIRIISLFSSLSRNNQTNEEGKKIPKLDEGKNIILTQFRSRNIIKEMRKIEIPSLDLSMVDLRADEKKKNDPPFNEKRGKSGRDLRKNRGKRNLFGTAEARVSKWSSTWRR